MTFAPSEIARLRQIFPDGVCDWSRRGVEQQPLKDTWLTYPRVGHYRSLNRGGDDEDRDRPGRHEDD